MMRRALVSRAVSVTGVVLGLLSIPLIAQAPAPSESQLTSTDDWSIEKHRLLARIIQRQIGVKDGWQAPRTAWGHPDLAGAWTSDSVHGVPRERPQELGNRLFVSKRGRTHTRRQAPRRADAIAPCAVSEPSG
jgi:hypothetical protein